MAKIDILGLLNAFGGQSIEGVMKTYAKSVAHSAVAHVRTELTAKTATATDTAALKQLVIDKFDHNRHLPGEVRQYLKRLILDVNITDQAHRLDAIDAAIENW